MIHIIGNVGVDLSMGPVDRLPTWGTELLAETSVYRPGGAAVNAALALAGLHRPGGLSLAAVRGAVAGGPSPTAPAAPVRVYCAVGDDPAGRELRDQLAQAGIPTDGLELAAGESTSLGLALVRGDGERAFVTDPGALRLVTEDWADRALASTAGPGWLLATCVSLFSHLPPAAVGRLFARVRGRDLRTALDTGWDVDGWPAERVGAWQEVLPETDLFLPNESEAAALTGQKDPAAAAGALQALGGHTVIVKAGPRGCWAADRDGVRHYPTQPLAVPDTTGAGDLFVAGVLHALDQGRPLEEAIRLGQWVSGVVLGNRRTYFPPAPDLLPL